MKVRYAEVDLSGVVVNVIIVDDLSSFTSPFLLVELSPGEACNIGWTYSASSTPRFEEASNA